MSRRENFVLVEEKLVLILWEGEEEENFSGGGEVCVNPKGGGRGRKLFRWRRSLC